MKNMKDLISTLDSFTASFFNRGKEKDPIITSLSFRLHHPLTVIILCVFALLGTVQLTGTPIQCSVDSAIDAKFMNTYCWIQSTYTLPERHDDVIGLTVISPGVGHLRRADESVQYHKYYQWVVFVLVFQAVLFYIPYYIWNALENGRLKMLLVSKEKTTAGDIDLSAVTNFLKKSSFKNSNSNNLYFRLYIFCEILNLLNVIGQMFFIDRFLGYEFSTYGTRVLDFIGQDTNRNDPMDVIFPKISKCIFRKFGPTGNIVNYDGLCLLTLNIFYEKMFIFLWFWYIIVAVITGMEIIWHFITLISPKVRTLILRRNVINFSRHPDLFKNPAYSALPLPAHDNPKFGAIRIIMNNASLGDWFVLYLLSKNTWPHHFKQLIRELALKFGWTEPKTE